MRIMLNMIRRFLRADSAATSIEYALIAALIGIVIITGVKAVGTKLSTSYANISANLK